MPIGINIEEITAQGIPQITGESELLPGFLVKSKRAPANYPVLVRSETEFKKLFGDYITTAFGAYVLGGFFLNGGRQAYCVRIIGTGGAAASVGLLDRGISASSTLKVEAGYKGQADKGVWGEDLTVVIADNAADPNYFDLEVQLNGVVKEQWRGLTPSTAVTAINNATSGSEFIKLTNLSSPATAPDDNPVEGTFDLTGGVAPVAPATADFDGVANAHTGLFAFDSKEITHLANAEIQDSTHLGKLDDYCIDRGIITGVSCCAQATTIDSAKTFGEGLQKTVSYNNLYLGWLSVMDPLGVGPAPLKWVPSVGHILGIYCRVFRQRGVHKAPAGVVDGQIKGAYSIDVDVSSDVDATTLADAGVNTLKAIPGFGRVVYTSRTLSKDVRWRYTNIRNLFNYIKRAFKRGTLFVLQEPNDEVLWRKVRGQMAIPFLRDLYVQGAFGSGKFEDAVDVICDASNNPDSEIELGNFHLDLAVYPSRPAESIYITVAQKKASGVSVVGER